MHAALQRTCMGAHASQPMTARQPQCVCQVTALVDGCLHAIQPASTAQVSIFVLGSEATCMRSRPTATSASSLQTCKQLPQTLQPGRHQVGDLAGVRAQPEQPCFGHDVPHDHIGILRAGRQQRARAVVP